MVETGGYKMYRSVDRGYLRSVASDFAPHEPRWIDRSGCQSANGLANAHRGKTQAGGLHDRHVRNSEADAAIRLKQSTGILLIQEVLHEGEAIFHAISRFQYAWQACCLLSQAIEQLAVDEVNVALCNLYVLV